MCVCSENKGGGGSRGWMVVREREKRWGGGGGRKGVAPCPMLTEAWTVLSAPCVAVTV